MKVEVLPDALAAALAAAAFIGEEARAAISARGRFVLAVSGGTTPWLMLRALADEKVQWNAVQVLQVDERILPAGDPARNLTHIQESLASAPLRPEQIHAMPVELEDLRVAAAQYGRVLESLAGRPPVLDLVHLGLGADGHTASLVAGDPALDVTESDVAVTEIYQGRRRMTLTYPILNRARRRVWLVAGGEKQPAFRRLQSGDASIPAGRVRQDIAVVFADRPALGLAVERAPSNF